MTTLMVKNEEEQGLRNNIVDESVTGGIRIDFEAILSSGHSDEHRDEG